MTEAIKTANTLARKTSINLALSFATNATDKKRRMAIVNVMLRKENITTIPPMIL